MLGAVERSYDMIPVSSLRLDLQMNPVWLTVAGAVPVLVLGLVTQLVSLHTATKQRELTKALADQERRSQLLRQAYTDRLKSAAAFAESAEDDASLCARTQMYGEPVPDDYEFAELDRTFAQVVILANKPCRTAASELRSEVKELFGASNPAWGQYNAKRERYLDACQEMLIDE